MTGGMRLRGGAALLALLLGLPAVAQPLPGAAEGIEGAPDTAGLPEVPDAAPQQPGTGGVVVRMNGDEALPTPAPLASAVLTVNDGALYAGSAWGARVQADLERLSRELAAENDRIYDQLSAEEDELTALRGTVPPADFRARAEAFDARAQAIRAERQAALRALSDHAEAEQRAFFSAAVPVIADVMAERGALVVLDQRMVFVSADAVDVTATLIERIDAEIGAGPLSDPEAPAEPAP